MQLSSFNKSLRTSKSQKSVLRTNKINSSLYFIYKDFGECGIEYKNE